MTKTQAIRASIKHWKEMIEWAEKQPPDAFVDDLKMEDELGQDWHGDSCALCGKYDSRCLGECEGCPLKAHYGTCGSSSRNRWRGVRDSRTWGEWVTNAKKFLKQLRSLLRKGE